MALPKGPQASTWCSPTGPSLPEESTPLVSFPGAPAPSAGFMTEEDKAIQPHSGLVKTGFLLLSLGSLSCSLIILTSAIFTPAAQQTWTPFLARGEVPKH